MTVPRGHTTEALVLRVVPFGETSQVVHLATPMLGLVPALAKGATRPGPELQGGLFLAAIGEATLQPRRGAELEILARFRVLRDLRALGRDLDRFHAACHVIELLRAWMRPGLGNPPLYRAGVTTLRALATSGTDALAAWVLFFEARAIAATGHRPALETCAGCGQPVPGAAAFSPAAGGLVHPACAPSGPRCRLSPRAREALERLYTERLPALAAEPLGPAALREARTVHDLLLPHLLERRLVAMALLGPVGDGGIRGPGRGRG